MAATEGDEDGGGGEARFLQVSVWLLIVLHDKQC